MKSSDTPTPAPDDESSARLDPATIAALFVQHGEELRRFLVGMLRNHEQANDVLQITFAKAIEKGHHAQRDALRTWLFRVAINEAIVIKRKFALQQRANQVLIDRGERDNPLPETNLVRWETVVSVRRAIDRLPPEQRLVVRARIYEHKKFSEIAAELNVPLGTVLTRMQLAMQKLKAALERPHEK